MFLILFPNYTSHFSVIFFLNFAYEFRNYLLNGSNFSAIWNYFAPNLHMLYSFVRLFPSLHVFVLITKLHIISLVSLTWWFSLTIIIFYFIFIVAKKYLKIILNYLNSNLKTQCKSSFKQFISKVNNFMFQ